MPAQATDPSLQKLQTLRANIQRVFLGNQFAVEKLIVCILARGHVLIEDVPGVGKTILATAMARSLDCSMSRIQLTPDMLPSDVLGVTVWDQYKSEFIFKPGPVFSNIILADEINRTTPRTQSALLEAMNEAQVSIDGPPIAIKTRYHLNLTTRMQFPAKFSWAEDRRQIIDTAGRKRQTVGRRS